jgi:PAS domain S-box-containing protein
LQIERSPKMKLPLHVLYLEDDVREAALVQDTLAEHGVTCQIRWVETQAQFIAALDEGGFEVILANYTIAGLDGLSVLLIAQERSPDVPFIFVSGTLSQELAIEALKSGATDCVAKSELPRLVPAIERARREGRERTERIQAEVERQAHLQFLESLDAVNKAIQSSNDLEQTMGAMLEVVLSTFGCDRAWLVYPCEPEAPAWRAVMEKTRPEFPGVFALGLQLPVDPEVAEVFRTALASHGAVHFAPGSQLTVPPRLTERFGVQSMIVLAVYPKWDEPYLFGLHQCRYPRTWTTQEQRLFEEIGRRLADALSSLLVFRSLRESEAKLEEASRLAHVGYWEREIEAELLTWSDETYRIFGLRPEDHIRTFEQFLERVHPEDRPSVSETAAEANRGGTPYDVEYRLIQPTGEVRTVHAQGEVKRDPSGRPYRMFGTVLDITERKRAERRILAQHRATQILAEADTLEEVAPELIEALCECLAWDLGALWHTDRQANVLRCVGFWRRASVEAPQFETATRGQTFRAGYAFPGSVYLSREPAYFSDFGRDANFPRAPIAMAEGLHAASAFPILLGGEVLGVIEFFSREMRPPDPDLLNMMSAIDSQVAQFIERKRAEEALQQAQAELSHLSRVTTLGELTASIAHEINQPLAALLTNANASLRWLAGDSPNLDETREAIRRIMRDGNRATEIIGRIRALARKALPQPGWLDLNQTIWEITAMIRGELHRNRVSLRTELATSLPALWGDRIQLQQVLLNLLINGIEALSGMDQGPRELMVSSETNPEVSSASAEDTAEASATAAMPGPHVLVTVQDTGPGLDPMGLERLFEAFYTTKPQGLGMGLAISRSIIQAHGGRLWASPNVPQGAVFAFALPIRNRKATIDRVES